MASTSASIMDKKLLVLYTGGTMGMYFDEKDGALSPKKGYLTARIMELPEIGRSDMPQFDIIEYEHLIDSSCMGPPDWIKIASDIEDNYLKYDGFVIIMGTDTMAYAASALSFMLENLAKTVVFTGSQIPFANVYNDARRNLIVSMIVAASSEFPEVCVCFNTKILRANRTVKMDSSGLDAFDSPNFPPLAQLAGKVLYNRDLVLLPPRGRFFACKTLESHVIVVKLVPGFDDEAIMALVQHSSSLRAIVLELYGTGNAPSRKTALVSALLTARERGIVVVGLSQCLRGGMSLSTYTMGKELARAGVISGGDMTTEACTTKLAYLCALLPDPRQVEHYVALNLRGELGSAVDHDTNSRPLRQAVIPQGLSKL